MRKSMMFAAALSVAALSLGGLGSGCPEQAERVRKGRSHPRIEHEGR